MAFWIAADADVVMQVETTLNVFSEEKGRTKKLAGLCFKDVTVLI